MNKIKVIKRFDCVEIDQPFGTAERSTKPTKREMAEVVGEWVADWRRRTEIETRTAREECARFRIGSSVRI